MSSIIDILINLLSFLPWEIFFKKSAKLEFNFYDKVIYYYLEKEYPPLIHFEVPLIIRHRGRPATISDVSIGLKQYPSVSFYRVKRNTVKGAISYRNFFERDYESIQIDKPLITTKLLFHGSVKEEITSKLNGYVSVKYLSNKKEKCSTVDFISDRLSGKPLII